MRSAYGHCLFFFVFFGGEGGSKRLPGWFGAFIYRHNCDFAIFFKLVPECPAPLSAGGAPNAECINDYGSSLISLQEFFYLLACKSEIFFYFTNQFLFLLKSSNRRKQIPAGLSVTFPIIIQNYLTSSPPSTSKDINENEVFLPP